MVYVFRALWMREFMQQMKNPYHVLVSLGFMLTFFLLAVLGMGQEAAAQAPVMVGVCWLALLVALQIPIPSFVAQDEASGRLIQLQLLPVPEGVMLLAKSLALWAALVLPLIVLSLPMAFIGGLDAPVAARMLLLMLPAGWAFWLISNTASLLLLGSARATALQLLIALPLAVPLMIFGAASTLAPADQAQQAMYLLAATALLVSAICPWIMGFLLRIHRAG